MKEKDKSKLWYDEENGILWLEIFDKFETEDVESFINFLKGFTPEQRRYLSVKIASERGQIIPDKEGRQVLKRDAQPLNLYKIAICGAKPTVRMFGKIAATALGRAKDTKFFATEEEAVAWLKAEKEKESK
jgi:hypothetical protein